MLSVEGGSEAHESATHLVNTDRVLLVRRTQRDGWNDGASVEIGRRSGMNSLGGKVVLVRHGLRHCELRFRALRSRSRNEAEDTVKLRPFVSV